MADQSSSELEIGAPVPSNRKPLDTEQLIKLSREGKTTLQPRSLVDIQSKLGQEAHVALPDELIETLGLENLSFQQVFHPDAGSILYLGFEGEETNLDNTQAIIDFVRLLSAGYAYGDPPRFDRLIPKAVCISGIDKQSNLPVGIRYLADYKLVGSTKYKGQYALESNDDFPVEDFIVVVPKGDFLEGTRLYRRSTDVEMVHAGHYMPNYFSAGMLSNQPPENFVYLKAGRHGEHTGQPINDREFKGYGELLVEKAEGPGLFRVRMQKEPKAFNVPTSLPKIT